MGLVANQVCSLGGGGEHANPRKLFEMVGFSVSLPVNPFTASSPGQIRDSSPTPRASLPGCSLILKRIERFWRFSDHPF
jgi:hypothetical protein